MFDALIRRGRAGAATLAAVAALAPVAAGCAAGADAQTNKPYSATEGTDSAVSSLKLRDVLIAGPLPGARLNPGDHAALYLTLVNDGTSGDRLERVATGDTFSANKITGGHIDVAPGKAVRIAQNPAITFALRKANKANNDPGASLTGGTYVPVTFTFTHAGAITVDVPVITRDRYFSTYAPAPSPSSKPSSSSKSSSSSKPSSSSRQSPEQSKTPAAKNQ